MNEIKEATQLKLFTQKLVRDLSASLEEPPLTLAREPDELEERKKIFASPIDATISDLNSSHRCSEANLISPKVSLPYGAINCQN